MPRALLTRRDGDAWSIQEHVGHLVDLDVLTTRASTTTGAGVIVLRAADL